MPERPKGADCKSAGYAFVGSNPTLGTGPLSSVGRAPPPAPCKGQAFAHIAQSVEHFLGKEEVTGSNPVMG